MSIRKMGTDEGLLPGGPGEYQVLLRARRAALAAQLGAAFPRPVLIVLELGSGHGHLLTEYAATTGAICAGVDICRDRIERAQRKRERAGLDHLHFFRCEAADFLACLPGHVSLDRVFILFPDPWPKRRHHKNRLVSASLLSTLASRATARCELFFRTDHRPYLEAVEGLVREHPDWEIAPGAEWPLEKPTVFQQRASWFGSLAAFVSGRPGAGAMASEQIHPDDEKDLDHQGEAEEAVGKHEKRVERP